MTFIEAALRILQQSPQPLTTHEITERAIEKRMLTTMGKTPEASMSAALYKEIAAGSPRVKKLSELGATRATRGSVRWMPAER